MTKRKQKHGQSRPIWLVLLGLVCLALVVALLIRGNDVTLFNPKGVTAQKQAHLIFFTVGVMLAVAIPSLLLLYSFAWRYRETNQKARYDPDTYHGPMFMMVLWAIPLTVLVILAHTMWPAAHNLDPHKPLASAKEPLTIQVVAMRWKWLFIYPEQNIATVNYVQVPINTPVQFDLTADEAPMSSFWIPHWGGQLYAMTGHNNQLNLMADTPGDYTGRSAEINGPGFATMTFRANASTEDNFEQWVQDVQNSPETLDAGSYQSLLVPSESNPAAFYFTVNHDLYDTVLAKYGVGDHSHGGH